jgi:two-component SAPR family response regulator
VERDGQPIERWGGDKAGTRQAQALFAFLFDRGERGIEKDEALELIWPDTDLERADLAFHRTLGGLRTTLETGRARGASSAIRFRNDRYRLDPRVVAWSDLSEFVDVLDRSGGAAGVDQLPLLERARALYRGDFLDDCPFYGDSVHVEERRAMLRDRFVDLVVGLGERYEAAGDRLAAATRYREAMATATEGSPAAEAGLLRLQA